MKQILIVFFALLCTSINAQIFHFDTHTAVLVKTTDQSPAHWYLEIFNDVGLDTTLRWKAHFDNVPSQWTITFEDQTMFHSNVQDGDSADFAFPVTGTFPQKLIIGAFTNNTPDDATVYFEIYDPYNPSYRDTIGYVFHISQGTNSLIDLQQEGILNLTGETIFMTNELPTDFTVVDLTGRKVLENKQVNQLNLNSLKKNEVFFIEIIQGVSHFKVKYLH
jgi:hypothetical protein